jgi:predicted exporter
MIIHRPRFALWPFLAMAASLLLLALGVAGALRLRLENDITALLPDRGEDRSALFELVQGAGFMRKVALVVGPGEPNSDALHQALDMVSKAVQKTPGVHSTSEASDMERVRLAAMTLAGAGANLAGTDIDELDREDLAQRLEDLKQRLAAPEGMVTGSFLLADPLGLGAKSLACLEGMSRFLGATVERGHLLSEDRRHGLVALTLDFDPMDVDRSGRFLEDLEASLAAARGQFVDAKLQVVALGGVHFAWSSASMVRGDIVRAFVLTSIAVALVFLLLLRRLRFLPVALLPAGLGIATGVGVFGLLGVQVHGLTLGFAATLTGISVDYSIHLLYHALCAEPALAPKRRMGLALARTCRPILLGCLTTVAAFLLISTSGFPGIRQLALFAALSVPVAMATTLLILPPMAPVLLRGGAPPSIAVFMGHRFEKLLGALSTTTARALVLTGALGALCGFLCLAFSGRLSGDPKELGSEDPELVSRQDFLQATFLGATGQIFLVATGSTLEQALEANDSLYAALIEGGVHQDRILTVATVLPSRRRQEASQAAVVELFNKIGGLEPLLTSSGFTPQFAASAARAYESEPLTRESYAGTALESLLEESVFELNGGYTVLTRIAGANEPEIERLSALAAGIPGCSLVSERLETRAALERMVSEMARMLGVWLVVTVFVLLLVWRSPRFALAAMTPSLLGVSAALAALAIAGRPVTAVASAGLTLVLGLGVDYGIFVLSAAPQERRHTCVAVFASGLTTIAGFGVLAAARIRAMSDLGLIILVGVTVSLLAALLVAPAFGSYVPKGEKG